VAGPKGVGRPHVPVDIGASRRVACGLHIAVRHAVLALLDLRGQVIAQERLPHASTAPREVAAGGPAAAYQRSPGWATARPA
jgi:hypothetical protein